MGGKKNKKPTEQQKNKEIKTEVQTEDTSVLIKKEEEQLNQSKQPQEKVQVQNTSENVTENVGEANLGCEQAKVVIGSSEQKEIAQGSDQVPKTDQEEQHQSKGNEGQKQTDKRLNQDQAGQQQPQLVPINNQQSQANDVLQNQNILKGEADSQHQNLLAAQQPIAEPQTKQEHQIESTATHIQKYHNHQTKNEQQLTTSVDLLVDASIIAQNQEQAGKKVKSEQPNTNHRVQPQPKQQDVSNQGEKHHEQAILQTEKIEKAEHIDESILQNSNLPNQPQLQQDIAEQVQQIKQNQQVKQQGQSIIQIANSDQHQVVINSHFQAKAQPEIQPEVLDKPKQSGQNIGLNNNQHSASKIQSREIDINQAVEESDYNSSRTKWQGNEGQIFTMVESYDVSDDSQKINIENSQQRPIEMKQSLSFSDLNSSLPIYSRSQDEPQHQQMKKQERAQEELANNQIGQLDIKPSQTQNVSCNEVQEGPINLQQIKKAEEPLEEPKVLEKKSSKPWERLGVKKAKQEDSKQIAPSPSSVSVVQPTHPNVLTEISKQIVEQKTQVVEMKVQVGELVAQRAEEKQAEVVQSDESVGAKVEHKVQEILDQQQIKQDRIVNLNEESHQKQIQLKTNQNKTPVASEVSLHQSSELAKSFADSEQVLKRRKKRIEELQNEKKKISNGNKNNAIFKGICSLFAGVAIGGLSFAAKKNAKASIAMGVLSGLLFAKIL